MVLLTKKLLNIHVLNSKEIKIIPDKFKKHIMTLDGKHTDWNISRQLCGVTAFQHII